ncbi:MULTISPECIES: AMP-binding protein [Sphingobium]|jgi:acyl-CoA synthetase (AMP-forming)/AMP-acid ligase II|uniref:AMP-binding protein n=1 Tax=Sphingobium TaxID=165695 RepID=UPI000C411567|nr:MULTISPECIES: AMP-binding protein [Sphingobium]MBS49019.1 acyl-CoA synthetase [Sphingobium sp.]MCC4256342.1 AMP-binding protein [Sphingobium lactosutens]MEC9018080.1 AMP-binding protein [Pseudomonadota bacterium]HCW61954.1 acyl-CoA synthetase [Sphingobium sp.]|tara:strand:- start:1874 stop:3430 length:1557 start_codon:yes stop_codon:yes gene_type:complete
MTNHADLAPYIAVHHYGLGDLLHEQARSRPHMIAAIDGEHRFTYAEFDERVNRLAGVLRARGVGHGDRVLWLGQNSMRVLEALLASARVGAIFCPANWRASVPEISTMLDDFDPKVTFWQNEEIGEGNRQARDGWKPDSHWICHDGCDGEDSYEALLAAADPESDFAPVDTGTPLLAIYTAAFSGRPGAALLSHESLLIMAWLALQSQKIDEHSGYLVSGPMFHIGVLMGTLGTFLAGGRNAFVPRVDAENLLRMIEAEKLTHAFVPQPTVLQMREVNKDGTYDVTSLFADNQMSDWRMPMVMPADAPAVRKLGGYGQTEIGGLTSVLWMGGQGAGRPVPFVSFKIGDEEGNELPRGQTGEIFARGPIVMCGYWNRPEENARRVVNGWHRTNDLGKRLEDGSLVFVGPKTTMIKTGIENVYPAEVEACLRQHPGVADVCVIGVPDPKWDQNVKAVVIRREGVEVDAQALIDHCRDRMASYKKPKIVHFVDSLPRTAQGFVDRAAVDADFGGGGYPSVG